MQTYSGRTVIKTSRSPFAAAILFGLAVPAFAASQADLDLYKAHCLAKWDFHDAADFRRATVGPDMIVGQTVGGKSAVVANVAESKISFLAKQDIPDNNLAFVGFSKADLGNVLKVPAGSHLVITNVLSKVVRDWSSPESARADWTIRMALYIPNYFPKEAAYHELIGDGQSDTDIFITGKSGKDGRIGIMNKYGYSPAPGVYENWHVFELACSAKNGLAISYNSPEPCKKIPADIYRFNTARCLFWDDNGEDSTVYVASVEIFDTADRAKLPRRMLSREEYLAPPHTHSLIVATRLGDAPDLCDSAFEANPSAQTLAPSKAGDPATRTSDDGRIRYQFAGYVFTTADGKTGKPLSCVTNFADKSFPYTPQTGTDASLVWLWKPCEYQFIISDPVMDDDGRIGQIAVSPALPPDGFYPAGTEVTLKLDNLSDKWRFVRWSGLPADVADASANPVSFKTGSPLSVRAVTSFPHTFRFDGDGDFPLIQITDLQVGHPNYETSLNVLRETVANMPKRPRLVILTGDNIISGSVDGFKRNAKPFIDTLRDLKLPFAVAFGNHDSEQAGKRSAAFRQELYEAYRELGGEYFVDHDVFELTGTGSGVIPLLDSKNGKEIRFNLFVMDSREYSPRGGYDGCYADQIQWYADVSGKTPCLWFQHIIVPESTNSVYHAGPHSFGDKKEVVCPPSAATYTDENHTLPPLADGGKRRTLYDVWVEKGNLQGAYFGHDHQNDYQGIDGNGILLGYAKSLTVQSYNDGDPGLRYFIVQEDGSYATETFTKSQPKGRGIYKRVAP